MSVLRSYVRGNWHTASDEGRPLRDAVTGEEVARLSSAGVDFGGALAHGRRVGGPALRELTFHQRAALLKALGQHLREHRDELYAVSAWTGATLGDSKFDVDGGIGVLLAYASKGRRELPGGTVYVDGAVEPLSQGGTFVGQHVCTPLHGVAVQVNAFNFPVWGPLEKLAPAFLAGMPSLVKPASPTAFLTARLVELVVESGILPEGTLQFVAGGVGDLFDHLTEQDTVSFTGSASTGGKLRHHPVIAQRGVRFTAEADSLNLSILGPDATPGTAEFDLFVKAVVAEMTVKAGQKCTAIRRAFVPDSGVDAVVEAITGRLARTTVGNPASEGVRMGALASLDQREEVRRGVKALADAGRIVFGDPERVDVVDADPQRGAFVSPILLVADPERAAPHEVEAFGPVCTVMPYPSTAHVVELAARGQGSLAGSIVTADPGFAREVVLGVAPWHGRLLVLNERDGKESTGHGSPLPALVHGGPGRAGGGEELGGIRGVLHHMQRTAIQADPDTLTAITGRWVPGARRHETDVHPFRKHLEELRPGDTVVAGPRTVTQADVEHFAEFNGPAGPATRTEATPVTTSTTPTGTADPVRRLGDAPPAKSLDPEERMSVDELRALQLERLQQTLRHAYENVPHYRRSFDGHGVHPDDCRELADLAKFPTTTKADLRDNYPFGMFAVPQDRVRRIHASSGTTGKPTVVGYTAADIENWAGLMARSIRAAGGRPGHKVHNAYGYGLFTGGLGAHYGIEKLGATAIPVSGGMTSRQVQLIRDFRPEIIMVTPTYMLTVIDEFEQQGLDPAASSLQVGIFGAEPWTERMRVEIEDRMDMHAVDIYGLSEVMGPGVSQECVETKDGLHLWEDHFYPEVVDPLDGSPLADGEEGELLFTSLTKEALPIIRYRTRDLTRLLPGTARPGMRRMRKIIGRSDDMIILRGVNVFPTQIEEIVLRTAGLAPHFQLVLTTEGRMDALAVRVEARPGCPAKRRSAAMAELVSGIKDNIGVTVRCEVVDPETLERSLGKLQRLKDQRRK